MLAGNVVCAWLMGRAAIAAQRHIGAGSNDSFHTHKICTAVYFAEHVLPRAQAQALMVKAGSASVMGIDADVF